MWCIGWLGVLLLVLFLVASLADNFAKAADMWKRWGDPPGFRKAARSFFVHLAMVVVVKAGLLVSELQLYVELANKVISQTERRVVNGESVPAHEKIVSIFEPHTDIIRKDRRDTYYGHKICLTSGPSGLVTDVVVEDGNPSDSTLAAREGEAW